MQQKIIKFLNDFSDKVIEFREKNSISQIEFSKITGISRPVISWIENKNDSLFKLKIGNIIKILKIIENYKK